MAHERKVTRRSPTVWGAPEAPMSLEERVRSYARADEDDDPASADLFGTLVTGLARGDGDDYRADLDAELEAAIEYVLAMDGIAGAERILEIVHRTLRRRV